MLQSRGTTTDVKYIWYGFAVCVAEYFFLLFLTGISLHYLRTDPAPPPPIIVPYIEIEYDDGNNNEIVVDEIPATVVQDEKKSTEVDEFITASNEDSLDRKSVV